MPNTNMRFIDDYRRAYIRWLFSAASIEDISDSSLIRHAIGFIDAVAEGNCNAWMPFGNLGMSEADLNMKACALKFAELVDVRVNGNSLNEKDEQQLFDIYCFCYANLPRVRAVSRDDLISVERYAKDHFREDVAL